MIICGLLEWTDFKNLEIDFDLKFWIELCATSLINFHYWDFERKSIMQNKKVVEQDDNKFVWNI